MKKLLLLLMLAASAAFGQTTTSVTGTVKDLSGANVTSGQVSFTLQPGIDTSMSGTARFTPSEIDCSITGTGAVKALDGVSTCTVTNNTALQPGGTSYKVCIQPQFIQPGSCFVTYATGTTIDVTSQIPTPPLTPAYNLVDTFSNQSIAGNKTFTGSVVYSGSLTFGALNLSGPLTETNGGTLGGTFAGNPTFSGNPAFNGNVAVGATNTLSVNTIKQQAGTAFVLADPNGVSHLFISNSAPYTNIFVQGNGSGSVFLGSASKTSVADTTGNIVTAGNIALQNSSQLLPATIANDTLGGLLFTTNAGKGWQIANNTGQLQSFAGVNILLQGATSGGVTLAVPSVAGSNTLTLPAATDTLVGQNTTDTLTNKTITTLAITGGSTNKNLRFNSSAQVVNGNTTDDGTNFSTGTLKLLVQNGIANNGTGFQHKRGVSGCATSASIGAACATTITWATAFADANYTVVGCVGNGVTSGFPVINAIGSKIAASISVQTVAVTAVAAQYTTIECTAVHD